MDIDVTDFPLGFIFNFLNISLTVIYRCKLWKKVYNLHFYPQSDSRSMDHIRIVHGVDFGNTKIPVTLDHSLQY